MNDCKYCGGKMAETTGRTWCPNPDCPGNVGVVTLTAPPDGVKFGTPLYPDASKVYVLDVPPTPDPKTVEAIAAEIESCEGWMRATDRHDIADEHRAMARYIREKFLPK